MRGRRLGVRALPALVLALGACAHGSVHPGAAVAAPAPRVAPEPAARPTADAAPPGPPSAPPQVASAPKPVAAKRSVPAPKPKPAAKASAPSPSPARATVAKAPARSTPAAAPRQVQARTPAGARALAQTPWSAEGCLTATDEPAAQAFAKERRAAKGPAVTLEPTPGGVVVVHRLAHACCLSAQVTSRVEGDRLVVTERLSGKACRCVCDSTIRTELSTPPGTHPLALDLYTAGSSRRAFEGTVEVR